MSQIKSFHFYLEKKFYSKILYFFHFLLFQPSVVSNFEFFDVDSYVAYGTDLSWVPVNQLQKYVKSVLKNLGTLQFPNPNGLSFQVQ